MTETTTWQDDRWAGNYVDYNIIVRAQFAFIVIATVMDYEITNIFETRRGKMCILINNFTISK